MSHTPAPPQPSPPIPRYVPLRVKTAYSFGRSIIQPEDLGPALARGGYPAAGVCDDMNVFGLLKATRSLEASGVKPVIGCDLRVADRQDLEVTVFCESAAGLVSLNALLTHAYVSASDASTAAVTIQQLMDGCAGLLVVVRPGHVEKTATAAVLATLKTALGDRLYGGLCLAAEYGRGSHVWGLWSELCRASSVPLVAVDAVRTLDTKPSQTLAARYCIEASITLDSALQDPRALDAISCALLDGAAIGAAYRACPEALEASVAIAARCTAKIERRPPQLPTAGTENAEAELRRLASAGLAERLAAARLAPAPYEQRLATELDVIAKTGFAGYFLVVADFIAWARRNGVTVGPGRGSGAGSLVAWATGITAVDPIEHGLLFERFINPERVSLPDFDIDLCVRGRGRVIAYLHDRYGGDRVSQIATFSTLAARAAVKDACRVLGYPAAAGEEIVGYFAGGSSIAETLALSAELRAQRDARPAVAAALDLAASLEGLPRNAGTHAAGVVIASRPLTEFAPLYRGSDGTLVVQYDKDDAEALGLVKFDLLGLTTLTILDDAERMIRARVPEFTVASIPMDDAATLASIARGETETVFQLESDGMRRVLKDLQPAGFEDVVSAVALFRPGPLQSGMVDDFIARRHRRKPVTYLHPSLKPVLESTYGVIVYQEQVMQMAQVMSGYTLAQADLLRRAMGKKKPEEMEAQERDFIAGARQRGIDDVVASQAFRLASNFAAYGFNKSHACAYAVLAMQTAYCKTHYPAEYFAAALGLQASFEKRSSILRMAMRAGVEVLPPDVRVSQISFHSNGAGKLRFGLGSVQGVSEAAARAIVEERGRRPFSSLSDFVTRVSTAAINPRDLAGLARSGALDGFGAARAAYAAAASSIAGWKENAARAKAAGQTDLFGLESSPPALPEIQEWTGQQFAAAEGQALGVLISPKRFDGWLADAQTIRSQSCAEVAAGAWRTAKGARIVGLLESIETFTSRSGRKLATLILSDETGAAELRCYPDRVNWSALRERLSEAVVVDVAGDPEADLPLAAAAAGLADFRVSRSRSLELQLSAEQESDTHLKRKITEILRAHLGGHCSVAVVYDGERRVPLGREWSIAPSPALLEALSALLGSARVRLTY